jgi:hypothetical protein
MRLGPPGHRIPPLLRKNIITSVEAEKLFKMYFPFRLIAFELSLNVCQIHRLYQYLRFTSRPEAVYGTTGLLEMSFFVHSQSVTVTAIRGRTVSQIALQYAQLRHDMTPSDRICIQQLWT